MEDKICLYDASQYQYIIHNNNNNRCRGREWWWIRRKYIYISRWLALPVHIHSPHADWNAFIKIIIIIKGFVHSMGVSQIPFTELIDRNAINLRAVSLHECSAGALVVATVEMTAGRGVYALYCRPSSRCYRFTSAGCIGFSIKFNLHIKTLHSKRYQSNNFLSLLFFLFVRCARARALFFWCADSALTYGIISITVMWALLQLVKAPDEIIT